MGALHTILFEVYAESCAHLEEELNALSLTSVFLPDSDRACIWLWLGNRGGSWATPRQCCHSPMSDIAQAEVLSTSVLLRTSCLVFSTWFVCNGFVLWFALVLVFSLCHCSPPLYRYLWAFLVGKEEVAAPHPRCKLIRRGISLEQGRGNSYTQSFPWALSFIIFITRKSILFCIQNCSYCLTGGCVQCWSLKVVDMSIGTDQGSLDAQGHCWVCISLDS